MISQGAALAVAIWATIGLLLFLVGRRPRRRLILMQTIAIGADKALVTATARDSKLNVPADLPAPVEWSASDGTVLGLAAVDGRPDQVYVLHVGPGTAKLLAKSGDLTAELEYQVPEVVVVPVADTLVLDSQIVPQ